VYASQRLDVASRPSLRRVTLEISSHDAPRVAQVIDILVSTSDARVSVVSAHNLKWTTTATLVAKDQATALAARFYDVQRTPERLRRRSVQAGGKAQNNE